MDGHAALPQAAQAGRTLRLEGLAKTFHDAQGRAVRAVDGVDLSIAGGELISLAGPSGCGKTTILRMVAGLETPSAGEIYLDEKPLTQVPAYQRNVGMVFQSYALFPHLTVFDNVAYPLQVRKRSKEEITRRVREALDLLGMADLEHRHPNRLSGGQQQRVAVARALVMRPDLLLFDEPLSNLDAKLRVQLRGEIRRVQKTYGITALYVTHDQEEAMAISDRIAIMNQGRIEQVGTPQEIYYHPANRFVADFLGRANFLKGQLVERDEDLAVVRLEVGALLKAANPSNLPEGTSVEVVVRPESIELRETTLPGSEGGNEARLEGRVHRVEFRGGVVEYEVAVADHRLLVMEVSSARPEMLAEGRPVTVEFGAGLAHILPG